jgi:hypothetical protein
VGGAAATFSPLLSCGCVVVADQVQLQPIRDSGIDELGEAQELLVMAPTVVLGDD